MPLNKALKAIPFVLILVVFFNQLFRETPFLQQELTGQAYWYACDGSSFLNTLFDPVKNDRYVGRFRFVEYLIEGAYWKSWRHGWIPHFLYDYFSIFLSLVIGLLLFLYNYKKKIKYYPALLMMALFLLSTNVFMVSLWHYRKAKVVASCILFLIVLLQRQSKVILTLLLIIGFFTDPYFIVLSPILLFFLDFSSQYKFKLLKTGVFAAFYSLLLLTLLNGWIGPVLNSKTKLMFYGFHNDTVVFLNLSNLKYIYSPLLDLMGVSVRQPIYEAVGWVCLALLLTATLYVLLKRKKEFPFLLIFTTSLPVLCYMSRPSEGPNLWIYSGYYGYVLFLYFSLMISDFYRYFITQRKNKSVWVLSAAIFLFLFLNQRNKENVFSRWSEDHLTNGSAAIYWSDYNDMNQIARYFKNNKEGVIDYPIDFENYKGLNLEGMYYLEEGCRHTQLAYVMLPMLFQDKLKSKRLRFIDYKTNQVSSWLPLCAQ